jgi:hypothetical protein
VDGAGSAAAASQRAGGPATYARGVVGPGPVPDVLAAGVLRRSLRGQLVVDGMGTLKVAAITIGCGVALLILVVIMFPPW